MAGYSGTPLRKKIGIREGHRIFLQNPPDSLVGNLGTLPEGTELVGPRAGKLDVAMLFVRTRGDLQNRFEKLARRLNRTGMIWVCWPKKSSKVESDLDFSVVQGHGLDSGLVDVKVCAIDEVWSGLKFVYRKSDR